MQYGLCMYVIVRMFRALELSPMLAYWPTDDKSIVYLCDYIFINIIN